MIMPAVTWYFYKRFDLTARYFLSLSEFAGSNHTNSSVMAKLNWNIIDPLFIFAGYSRANESFESGNPINPYGSFSANHIFGGFKFDIYNGIGLDFAYDYERRNNGSRLHTFNTGAFYRW